MKMPTQIEEAMIATCGMNCKVCYKHLAIGNHTKPCNGCRFQDSTRPYSCRNCRIYTCANRKKLEYCYVCANFPCSLIKNLDKSYLKRYNTSLIENSQYIKRYTIAKFLTSEKSKWKCKCGGIICLHDKICSECKADDKFNIN